MFFAGPVLVKDEVPRLLGADVQVVLHAAFFLTRRFHQSQQGLPQRLFLAGLGLHFRYHGDQFSHKLVQCIMVNESHWCEMSKIFKALLLTSISTLCLTAQSTVLMHATVIDGTGAAAQRDAAIVIENGRVTSIAPASKTKPPAGAQVVDLSGKFVIPGIINAHSHISDDPEIKLRHFALYGVTTTIGMGGDGDQQLKIREEQHNGNIRGARALTVQQRFEFAKDAPTPEAARQKVDELFAKHADAVKVVMDDRRHTVSKLKQDIAAAIIDQAHKHNMKVLAHIHDYDDAKFLIEQGVQMLAHEVRDREVDDSFINLMKSKNVGITPTLVRELSSFVYADSPPWLDDPFVLRVFDAERVNIAKTKLKDQQSKLPDLATNREDLVLASKNFTRMLKAGVKIGLGTDSGPAPARFEGFFEHLEMELMVKYGMTPMQVIQAFSKTNSEILGIDKDYGTLVKGKKADLVVLDKNPLDNILNTRTISAVYIEGKKFQ